MPTADTASERAHMARRIAQHTAASPWVVLFARFGYAAKGLVYFIIGGLAATAAMGAGGATTDQHGVVHAIYEQPFGRFLLIVVAIGWVGYALWCWIESVLDPDGKGTRATGVIARTGYAAIGVSYAGLAIAALRLATGTGQGGKSSDVQAQDWTARLLSYPLGVALVMLVGVAVLGIAGVLYYRAYSAEFRGSLAFGQAPRRAGQTIVLLGRLGYGALGVVFTIIGFFLAVAALKHDPGKAKGLGGALQELLQQPFGHLLLGVVGLGLFAYGVFSFAEARFRRIGSG